MKKNKISIGNKGLKSSIGNVCAKKVLLNCKKDVQSKGDNFQNLTQTEIEVLNFLTKEFLTIKQIALRRGTQVRAVYTTIYRLREKGILNNQNMLMCNYTPPCNPEDVQKKLVFWRVHNLHFLCKPFSFSPRYFKVWREVGNYGLSYRDWTVKFHKDMVEFQSKPQVDFRDVNKWVALGKVENSFNRTLREVASKYGFFVWKDGKCNIRLVNQHLASTNGDVSHNVQDNHLLLKGFDGRVWFEVDNSNGLREYEYRDPANAVSDSERLEPYFNDLRYNQPPTLSELACLIKEVVELHRETAAGLRVVVDLLKPQFYVNGDKDKRGDYIG